MLLPRALLRKQGFPLESVTFSRTEAGKPFIVSKDFFSYSLSAKLRKVAKAAPRLSPAVGYNISHDNQMVAMVSHIGREQDVDKLGIDVMKRALPKGETVSTFLRAINEAVSSQSNM